MVLFLACHVDEGFVVGVCWRISTCPNFRVLRGPEAELYSAAVEFWEGYSLVEVVACSGLAASEFLVVRVVALEGWEAGRSLGDSTLVQVSIFS